jgi:hypothetical protein
MGNVIQYVAPGTDLIPEGQVTSKRLSDILAASSIKCALEDGDDIYVLDGVTFPLWIALHQDLKLLLMFTYIEAGADESVEWLDEINRLNASIILPQFSYYEGRIWGRYWLTYHGGLNVRHLVRMLQRFANAFRTAVADLEIFPT